MAERASLHRGHLLALLRQPEVAGRRVDAWTDRIDGARQPHPGPARAARLARRPELARLRPQRRGLSLALLPGAGRQRPGRRVRTGPDRARPFRLDARLASIAVESD